MNTQSSPSTDVNGLPAGVAKLQVARRDQQVHNWEDQVITRSGAKPETSGVPHIRISGEDHGQSQKAVDVSGPMDELAPENNSDVNKMPNMWCVKRTDTP